MGSSEDFAGTPEQGRDGSGALAAFEQSFPETYRLEHTKAEILVHAAVVARRGDEFVHVEELLPEFRRGEADHVICVVTDDRPGLLSLLSAAIAAHSYDVLSARIYCRKRANGKDEAVDFFAVRRLPASRRNDESTIDVAAIRKSMASLLRGETDVDWLDRRASPTTRIPAVTAGSDPQAAAAPPASDVHFRTAAEGDALVVETPNRPGVLASIALALYRQRLNITRSNIVTIGGRARDEFVVAEIDGSKMTEDKKRAVIEAVSSVLERLR